MKNLIKTNRARHWQPVPVQFKTETAQPVLVSVRPAKPAPAPAPATRTAVISTFNFPLSTLRPPLLALALSIFSFQLPTFAQTSTLLEAAGQVEFATAQTNWQTARVGLALATGTRVRTHEHSRAAVQLADRSVIRLSDRTTLEILPPRNAEKKRFGLTQGALYFFNREKPADVEFDTPLAAGAIRGTEFLLEANPDSSVHLALIDGQVGLQTQSGEINLHRGEDLRLAPGQPPQRTALLNATAQIQWALYYPAIVNPADLALDARSSTALEKYRAGNLLGALAENSPAVTPSERIFRAQLELTVGQVAAAEALLDGLNDAPALALRELIATVRGEKTLAGDVNNSTVLLARSYAQQARAELPAALAAAQQAARLAPDFGFAHARLAELEFSFGHRRTALTELDAALKLSPQLASAYALQGFVLLDQNDSTAALAAFDHARELDSALGSAWLGRGLCLLHEINYPAARESLQAAAALEPQRGLFRSYLGKAASELGDAKSAAKEFRLAKELDPADPTAWLYSALHLWQQNQLNAAIRDLEISADKNDNRAAFRSQLLLDGDRAVRSANLAALYDEAGIPEASRRAAARAVNERYANFSGHLFLANSLQAQEDVNRFDLRLEAARQSELLVANLLAPSGAGNLSQLLSQQDHLRFFDARPIGVSSLTEYRSTGDWREAGTAFGMVAGLSYALDASYENLHGQQPNGAAERRQLFFTAKQRITADDELYFQIGHYDASFGDVTSLYNPATANTGFRGHEKQEPTLYLGWHHAWSPGQHTLFLFSRLDDQLDFINPQPNTIFLHQSGGAPIALESILSPLTNEFSSHKTLYSAELQHVLETPKQSLVVGARFQSELLDTHTHLRAALPGPPAPQDESSEVTRVSLYGYYTHHVTDALQLIGGVSYDHLEFPVNTEFAPISANERTRDVVSPKVGLLFAPWQRGLLRASYTRSLGGVNFDNSIRLEPTQVGGFNQTWRSLIPESVAGPLAGADFTTTAVGFDQSFAHGTWFGAEAAWLTSDGTRSLGALSNSTFLPIPDAPAQLPQRLEFKEFNFSAYAAQLLGEFFTASARYKISEAKLATRFPNFTPGFPGLNQVEQNERAMMQQLSLALNFSHPCGAFGQWESAWTQQSNAGQFTPLAGENLWQHNLTVGWRFARRAAELRVGVLNLFDQDYRLNALNLHAELPRSRTFVASLRLNF